jgi:uncharacterized DUF497 family protein
MDKSFIWDIGKANANIRKHQVSFEEAATVFKDPLALQIHDPEHSVAEPRWLLIGWSERTRILIVVYVERQDRIRIISARKATRQERNNDEEDAR